MHDATLSLVSPCGGRDLAKFLYRRKDYAAAEKLFAETLELHSNALGPTHRRTLFTMRDLACVIQSQGRPADAEPLYRQALELVSRVTEPGVKFTIEVSQGGRRGGQGSSFLRRRGIHILEATGTDKHAMSLKLNRACRMLHISWLQAINLYRYTIDT